MGSRVLSREESQSLSPEAARLVYKFIHSQYCPAEIIEKALLQAVILAGMNQYRVDADTISFIMEKISEYEGVPLFDPDNGAEDTMGRYC
ncbi:MAG: hypothetical protein LBS45_06090 [Synergistaceae bacterium]|jgi:hypothetical protein|nr:hypothetical protein [Synergistaceae bacterium]